MAQVPSIASQSLLAWQDRLLRAPVVNVDGNYSDSIIHAPLCEIPSEGDAPIASSINAAATPALTGVLFTSDALAHLSITQYALGVPAECALALLPSTGPTLINIGDGSGVAVTQTSGGAAGEGQVYTVNGLTLVPGYGFSLALVNAATGGVEVAAWSQSGIQHGWAKHTGKYVDANGNTITTSVQDVIIRATDYTAAIRAAGNIVKIDVAGVSSDVYRVVGVYEAA